MRGSRVKPEAEACEASTAGETETDLPLVKSVAARLSGVSAADAMHQIANFPRVKGLANFLGTLRLKVAWLVWLIENDVRECARLEKLFDMS